MVGKKVFIRTVTHYFLGLLEEITKLGKGSFLILTQCSWVADTRRFHSWIADGPTHDCEVEPYPKNKRVYVNIESIIDICEWDHTLEF